MIREAANEYRQARRKISAERGTVTRRKRRDARVANVAAMIAKGQILGPHHRCAICGRRLEDETAVTRGVGSECWSDVQTDIERKKISA